VLRVLSPYPERCFSDIPLEYRGCSWLLLAELQGRLHPLIMSTQVSTINEQQQEHKSINSETSVTQVKT
jgi:hypothetical protein